MKRGLVHCSVSAAVAAAVTVHHSSLTIDQRAQRKLKILSNKNLNQIFTSRIVRAHDIHSFRYRIV